MNIAQTETPAQRFGLWLKNNRKQRGMTQIDVAAVCDVTNTAVTQWESGRNLPSRTAFDRVARHFNCQPAALMEELNTRLKTDLNATKARVQQGVSVDAKPLPSMTLSSAQWRREVCTLSVPTYNGKPIRGAENAVFTVIFHEPSAPDGATSEEVALEYAAALIETAPGFATLDIPKAIETLRIRHPYWTVIEGSPVTVPVELD